MTEDQIVLGQNLVWSVFGLTVGVIYLIRAAIRGKYDEPFWLMAGIAAVALGSGLHRAYWFVGRWLRTHGNREAWEVFADNAAWGLSPIVMLIVAGYACHLAPMVPVRSVYWFFAATGIAFGFWTLGALSA